MAEVPEDFQQAQATLGNTHVELGLHPSFGKATHAYALVKQTYAIDPVRQRCVPVEAEPLHWDIRIKEPRIQPGTDFWLYKGLTDVVVVGSAFAPEGQVVTGMKVAIHVANHRKQVAVSGNRAIEWTREGQPRIGLAKAFSEIALTPANAYGGVDARVPIAPAHPLLYAAAEGVDHPGLYPRNPLGKGYIVDAEPLDGLQMPNLEDPGDKLSADRLVVGEPELWYRQPFPWYLGPVPMLSFPRYMHVGAIDAWYPAPQDERMPEVRRGYLPSGYSDVLKAAAPPTLMMRQEASHGLMLQHIKGGEPVVLEGMHPEYPSIGFAAPSLPRVELNLDGARVECKPVPTSLRIEPDKLRVMLTCAATLELPRMLVPGIHKHVDLVTLVDGQLALRYEPPQTVSDRLAEAQS